MLTKQFINSHPEILIIIADKENVTVISNKVDYISKMENIFYVILIHMRKLLEIR